ncbi:MAG: UDP-N-acetylmuramate--L-alanine ligase [Thermomicrobiales bacterium]
MQLMTQFASADPQLPPPPANVHFIGIGGIGMSGLARILLAWGYRVSGSDAVASVTTDALALLGATIVIGHDDPTMASLADIIVSTPRAEQNAAIEIDAAHAAGVLHVKRGLLLAMLANARRSIAVAGSHGKSTTTGMLAFALRELDTDPSYAIGAILAATGLNAAPGNGPFMPVEADEFDRAFLWLKPEVAMITTVSFDHPDVYADQADYDAAFVEFATGILPGGRLVISADDPGARRVVATLRAKEDLPFSIASFGANKDSDWRICFGDHGGSVTAPDGTVYEVQPLVPGRHNVGNTVAAAIALEALGIEPARAIPALTAFTGIGRRFEHKGTLGGIDIVDDYAHHPDEIEATLQATRERFPDRRVIVAFQPHTYSRTKLLLDEFATSLNGADEVVLLEIYPSGEKDTLGVSSADVLTRLTVSAQAVGTPEQAVHTLAKLATTGDVILTLGAGDITIVGASLLARLFEVEPAPAPVLEAAPERPARRVARRAAGPPAIEIAERPRLKVQPEASMSLYTTMRIGGPADFLVRAQDADDIVASVRWAAAEGLPVTVIGGGSNLLVRDGGIRGLVIIARTPGERAAKLLDVQDLGDRVEISVGAQAPLSWVGRYCAEQGWAGMDWGVGLPGQIGGATVDNAGAHGAELKDHLVAIDLLTESGEIERKAANWLAPTYRMTRIKGEPRPRPWIVLHSIFHLPKEDPVELVRLANEHAEFRKNTQPTGACSGSTFANPPGDYAGRLLEQAGLKGYTLGAMQLSPKHANWVVNTGGGTAMEAWALIQHARSVILERDGVDLRPEVERVGEHAG